MNLKIALVLLLFFLYSSTFVSANSIETDQLVKCNSFVEPVLNNTYNSKVIDPKTRIIDLSNHSRPISSNDIIKQNSSMICKNEDKYTSQLNKSVLKRTFSWGYVKYSNNNDSQIGINQAEIVVNKGNCFTDKMFKDAGLDGINHIVFAKGVTKIDSGIQWQNNLKTIILPEGVTEISDSLFWECKKLEMVGLPSTVVRIADNAFCGCISLKSINLPSKLREIGTYAFADCAKLEKIKIPNYVTKIGKSAFECCSNLFEVRISNSLDNIEDDMFRDCGKLREIQIPANVIKIGKSAFECCYSLTQMNIPATVKVIEDNAFMDCKSLEILTLNIGLRSIGRFAFLGCDKLKQVTIPPTIDYLGYVDGVGNCSFAVKVKLKFL